MKYDLDTIHQINLFETITKSHVKDCFLSRSRIVFVVNEDEIKKVIGPNGVNIKKFEKTLNKKIKVVAYSSDPVLFVKSFIAPIIAKKIEVENGIVNIYVSSMTEKGLLIGRDRKNLDILKGVVKRYYPNIIDVRIV